MTLQNRFALISTSLLFSWIAFASVLAMPTTAWGNTSNSSTRGTVLSVFRVDQFGRGYAFIKTVRTFSGQTRLFGDFFNNRGVQIRGDVEIGLPNVSGNQVVPVASSLMNGGYAIAWRNDHPSATGGIRYSVITTEGSYVTRDIRANILYSATLQPTQVIGISHGGFIIAWRDMRTAVNWYRSFTSQGVPTSGDQRN